MVRAEAIGWRAHVALTTSASVAKVIAPLSRSFYAEAAGELIWIGDADALLHPRAVLATDPPAPAAGASVHVVWLDGVAPWRPVALPSRSSCGRDSARALQPALAAVGKPRSFACLLAAGDDDDPVTTWARPHVAALARACAANDATAFADAARPLLGLGTGLTPAGDDFVGGALFARRVFFGTDPAWDAAAVRIVADAVPLTHPISARLLADLAAGEGWAPMHELAAALAVEDAEKSVAAARDVTSLGHTSGWDLLTGIVAGLAAFDGVRLRRPP